MLKTIRITLAILSLLAVTLLFVDFSGSARTWWPWLAQVQLMPALLSANALALVVIAAMTLLLGRVYCSVICPLGILQDVANWLRGHVGSKRRRKNRFKYVPTHTAVRLGVFTIFVVLVVLGLTNVLAATIAGLIEPYSAYGRIASQIFAPVVDWLNNLLAGWSESQTDNYAFYRVAYAVSVPVLVVAIVTLVVVVTMAWRGGRDYCNTICPVGTILGYLSQFSLLKPVINTDKCINCGKCARNCKAKCINAKAHAIDYTRCVACMDCISTCSEGAIEYTWRRSHATAEPAPKAGKPSVAAPVDAVAAPNGRRGFLVATGLLAGSMAIKSLAKTTDGGLTELKDKKPAKRQTPVVPAGAVSLKHLRSRCTGCQLCIQSCPSHVLKPTLGLDGFMQPHLDFTNAYCDPSCTVCSNVCPVGAIEPVTEEDKTAISIGRAVVDLDACLSASQGVNCGSCESHCPAGAIQMVETAESSGRWMPVVNGSMCIGCGSCEYHCPVGTVSTMTADGSAIHVEGLDVHREV